MPNKDNDNKILEVLETETNKVKNYINKTLNFHYDINSKEEPINIHECLIEALDVIDKNILIPIVIKDFDPSIPKISFNRSQIIKCFENLLYNACESKNNIITSCYKNKSQYIC